MTPKEYYKNYLADSSMTPLNRELIELITTFDPVAVMEFGTGVGKNLAPLQSEGIVCHGLDISPVNVSTAIFKYDLKFVSLGDESHLRHLCNMDVVFTCSVLDHIENVADIIGEFKRIANKAVILAECTHHDPSLYYWNQAYAEYGFEQVGNEYITDPETGDGFMYKIWVWEKKEETVLDIPELRLMAGTNDDYKFDIHKAALPDHQNHIIHKEIK